MSNVQYPDCSLLIAHWQLVPRNGRFTGSFHGSLTAHQDNERSTLA